MKPFNLYLPWTTLVRRMFGHMGREKYWFSMALVGFISYSLSMAYMGEIFKIILAYLNQTEPNTIIPVPEGIDLRTFAVGSILGVMIIRSAGGMVGGYAMTRMSAKFILTLRSLLYQKFFKVPLIELNKRPQAESISRINFTASILGGSLTGGVATIVREGLTSIALIGYLFYLSPVMTLFLGLTVPFAALLTLWVSRALRHNNKILQKLMSDITKVVTEGLQASHLIRLHQTYSQEKGRLMVALNRLYRNEMRIFFTSSFGGIGVMLLLTSFLAGFVYFALSPHTLGTDSGMFLAYLTGIGTLGRPIRALMDVNRTIQQGLVAASDVYRFLDKKEEADTGSLALPRAHPELRLEKLGFVYPILKKKDLEDPIEEFLKNQENTKQSKKDQKLKEKAIKDQIAVYDVDDDEDELDPSKLSEPEAREETKGIQNIDLTLSPASVTALVGRSGAGKSTLIQALTHLYEPTSGDIYVDGVKARDIKKSAYQGLFSYVPQKSFLFNLSLKENVTQGLPYDADRLEQALDQAGMLEVSRTLEHGIETKLGDAGSRLSGGQIQRISIARALYRETPILIFDEATASLDSESEQAIKQTLNRLRKEKTLLLIAHRLSTVQDADQIVVLDDGEIAEKGNHKELLALGGIYTRMCQAQKLDS